MNVRIFDAVLEHVRSRPGRSHVVVGGIAPLLLTTVLSRGLS